MIQMDIPAAYVCAQIFAYCGRDWLAYETPSWGGKYIKLVVSLRQQEEQCYRNNMAFVRLPVSP